MGGRHPVDELARCGAAFQCRLEIGQVAAAFVDLAVGVVVGGPWIAVAGDQGVGLQRRHGVQRPRPVGPGGRCRSRQPHVRPVVLVAAARKQIAELQAMAGDQ